MSTTFLDTNNTNAIIIATPRFWFSEGATTAAMASGIGYGYEDLGNVNKASIKTEVTRKKVYGSYRGDRKVDKSFVTQSGTSFELESHECNKRNLGLLFCASAGTNHTQVVKTAADADALAFTAQIPSVSTRWYDIMFSGIRYGNLTTVTVATKTEGTDFVIDYTLGRIRFITTQTATITPVVTSAAITSSDANYFEGQVPLGTLTKEGFGRLTLFDQNSTNRVVADYVDFKCQVTAEGTLDFDGENESKLKVTVEIMGGVPGNLLTRMNLS
jgi:hypothetical protein